MKGCKNCPAYAKCTVTYRGSACSALRSTYGIDTDPEIITNADRIRDMSDEELAKAMDMLCPPVTNCIDGGECVKCWIEWLRKPAEED